MEELNEICEVLMEKCACAWVRDQTNEIHEKYNTLLTQIQGKIFISQKKLLSFSIPFLFDFFL